MKKRRPYTRNYSPSQKHSCTHERLSIRTKSIHDPKGRNSRRSCAKLQQNNEQFDNDSRLKRSAFGSLESLFDIRKPLNLLDVRELSFDHCNEPERILTDAFDTVKLEPFLETLFLQPLLQSRYLSRTNSESRIDDTIYFEEDAKNELKMSEELDTETSNFTEKLQQDTLIYNKENYTASIAEVQEEMASPKITVVYLQREIDEQKQQIQNLRLNITEDNRQQIEQQIEEIKRTIELKSEEMNTLKQQAAQDLTTAVTVPLQPQEIIQQIEYREDELPKIILCGMSDNPSQHGKLSPRIVVAACKQKGERFEHLTGQLTESLSMQERLIEANVQLEGGKHKLEKVLLEKDAIIENLESKLSDLQEDMRRIVQENKELNSRAGSSQMDNPGHDYISSVSPRLTGGGSTTEASRFEDNNTPQNVEICTGGVICTKAWFPQGMCPAELENKFTTYDTSAKQLEQQLGSMEYEVRNMRMELVNVQRERQQLEQQRKLLKCTGPCATCACPPTPCVTPSALKSVSSKGPAAPATSPTKGTSTQQQLRDLREQYARLQEDYKNKLCEVSCMRTDAEKMKQDLRDAKEEKERIEIKMIDIQERLKFLEEDRGNFEGHKEQLVEQEQALMVAKQRMRETQDELEELRSTTQDLSAQLEDYRNKYLQAQQQVEEQRRQMDLMEMDNARMNENVTLEIGRVKNQFQEKLAELAPLPEILKQSQTKLQETQQIRLIAERNCEDLSRELQGCNERLKNQQNEMEVLRAQYQTLLGERGQGTGRFEEIEKKCGELRNENERMKNTLTRFEEQKTQLQKRMDEKMHENAQLLSQLDQVREESARQVARTKDRCENVRWSMQRQIAEMERELAQCRATARTAQRDRDEIRQKMQGQINNLNEAFEQAQGRIRSLQGHVNYLKTSYSNMLIGQRETPTGIPAGDAPGLGYDSCDCNY